jgi:hypothetical protein
MFNYVPIKHKHMSFVSNGGKFKLYTVLNGASANNCAGKALCGEAVGLEEPFLRPFPPRPFIDLTGATIAGAIIYRAVLG